MALPLAPILQHLHSEPSRTWSIVITLFGDAVIPRGGSLWLGSLLEIFNGLGVASGVVRTAMSRLASDHWLERTRIGRNSFYRLTEQAQTDSQAAARRIYGSPPDEWDGRFDLLLDNDGVNRDGARLALQTAGFGALAPGLWVARGCASVPSEAAALLRMQSTMDLPTGRQIALRAWPLDKNAAAYQRFLKTFAPLQRDLGESHTLPGRDALVARTLLMHEFRRIVLRDPGLPLALLPSGWPGARARRLCGETYHALLPASEAWLDEHGRNENGPLPNATADLRQRFLATSHVTEKP